MAMAMVNQPSGYSGAWIIGMKNLLIAKKHGKCARRGLEINRLRNMDVSIQSPKAPVSLKLDDVPELWPPRR